LAVGDVSYDSDRQPAAPRPPEAVALLRAAARGENRLVWPPLSGTRSELEAVAASAGPRPVVAFTGAEADTARVLATLPQARWAHLATHGFFADPAFRSSLHLDESAFARGRDRAAPGSRNPLVLSGLVLAGANLPVAKDQDGIPQGDGGILTAEAIAGLPLQGLELVVLSACETGLGEVAGGEGVFGLQRAFHIAGARDVVASLWKVNDQATAALMKLFYHKLWVESEPPLAALRGAQLALYRHPERIGTLAGARGPDFTQEVTIVEARDPARTPNLPAARAEPWLWAGFVLSGTGGIP
jgi:CHAT domain-containing protein